jgi:uncharacterized phage infection (PIP) family protein YhgE
MYDTELINVNRFKTLTGKELYDVEFNQSFSFIIKTAVSFVAGLLSVNFINDLLEYIIPNNKYHKILKLITLFFVIIFVLLLASILITNHEIKIKQNEKLKEITK